MKPIRTKSIAAYPKNTGANTQYWEMSAEDRSYIFEHLVRYLANIQEAITADSSLLTDFYKRRPSRWPRGRFGPNSDASMLGGLVDQLLKGNDLTTNQLDAVEQMFDTISQMYEEEGLTGIRFDRRIFRIE